MHLLNTKRSRLSPLYTTNLLFIPFCIPGADEQLLHYYPWKRCHLDKENVNLFVFDKNVYNVYRSTKST